MAYLFSKRSYLSRSVSWKRKSMSRIRFGEDKKSGNYSRGIWDFKFRRVCRKIVSFTCLIYYWDLLFPFCPRGVSNLLVCIILQMCILFQPFCLWQLGLCNFLLFSALIPEEARISRSLILQSLSAENNHTDGYQLKNMLYFLIWLTN